MTTVKVRPHLYNCEGCERTHASPWPPGIKVRCKEDGKTGTYKGPVCPDCDKTMTYVTGPEE